MNWISNVVRPKIRSFLNRRESPENLWIKCPETGQLVFYKDVEANQFVIPGSNYHLRMSAGARLRSVFDNQTWYDVAIPQVAADPLKFRDERKYADRLKEARAKTGAEDCILAARGSTVPLVLDESIVTPADKPQSVLRKPRSRRKKPRRKRNSMTMTTRLTTTTMASTAKNTKG